jgi:hypothetical protein
MADAARIIKAIKTATFKLHNPSKRKQALLNRTQLPLKVFDFNWVSNERRR